MSSLPNCIVIGAMKAGTTSMHNYLSMHPDIFASEVKEINFFVEERKWNKGIDWYRNQFDPAYKIRVESSQNYTKRHIFGNVPEKIKKVLGNEVKLIYIVRKPIKRMKSHYLELLTAGHVEHNISFNDALHKYMEKSPLEEHHLVRTSMYAYQLEPYLSLFRKENICIVRSEDLCKDTLGEMNRIFAFLGLNELDDPHFFQKQYNRSIDKYYDPVWLRKLYNRCRQLPGGHLLVDKIKTSTPFRIKITKNQMSLDEDITKKLEMLFSNNNSGLEKLEY